MLSSNLPYIKSIRKTIHTTIWPNHVSNSNNNNNSESESTYNRNGSSLKRPDSDAVSEPAVDKGLIEKGTWPNTQSCQLAGDQVKVVTPHPEKRRLTHPRPDSPLVEEARALKRQDVGRWERISEREEEEESEDLADCDFDDEEEADDSVFEESGDEEESGCSKSSSRCRRYI